MKTLRNISAERFNELYPVGALFRYYHIRGVPDYTTVTTRTPAWALGHGAVVVSVSGRAGGVSIEHLEPIPVAKCKVCGCDDHHACVSDAGVPCHWVQINREKGTGICSQCAEQLNQSNLIAASK
ncbi:hypothetical protein [Leminorella grimontii]|uniref:hypothetical protein n=1 Tax=Leminorella grimontii TaxID=82981 RepID=UPI00321F9A26